MSNFIPSTQRFFVSFLLVTLLWQPAMAMPKAKLASILILMDLSGSMNRHQQKLQAIAPIIEKAMENSRCSYQVGVANIAYEDRKTDLTPFGTPAWITDDMEEGPKEIASRISNPIRAIYGEEEWDDEDSGVGGPPDLPSGTKEKTYSSLVSSLEHNFHKIKDSDVIGTLLLTDAVPAFETWTPEVAEQKIHSLTGSTPYISAVIGPDLSTGFVMPEPQACSPDFQNSQLAGNPLNMEGWLTRDVYAIDQFTKNVYGSQWNICKNDYDEQLRQFIESILAAGECLLVV
ncbi:MAG: hypothetical protein AAF203_03155 [Pseudomonadota bacterium]